MSKKFDLEKIFLTALGSDERLKWYLKHNINMIDYLNSNWLGYMTFVDMLLVFVPKDKRRELFNEMTSKKILKMLERERPDLFKTINNEKGLVWMENQIKNFEERFL